MATVETLRDDFAGAALSTSAWVEAATGSATVAQTSGQIRFTLPSSVAGAHIARLTSRYTYDLSGSSFYINIGTMVATGVAAQAFFQLYLDGANTLQWVQVSGTLYARSIVAGVSTDEYSVAWNATTYKYLRIRASGGNIEWHSSTNGTVWTLRGTKLSIFPVTGLFVDFGASCGNIASPGSFRLDDVNLILPAVSTNWNWDNGRRALVNRHKRTTLAIDTANTAQGYLVTADGVDVSDAPSGSVRYWSGPAGGGRLLTEHTTEAAAQAMAVNLPLDGTFDLPQMVDARLFRLGHRSIDGSPYSLRSFFPRTLVRASDIEAESILAINIAASAITVDKLDATLTITGKTIQTAYNGARVVLSGDAFGGFIGYGDTDTYNPLTGTGTYQVLWSLADGVLYAGAGAVALDENGITLDVGTNIVWTSAGLGTSEVGVNYNGTVWRLDAVEKDIIIATTSTADITLETESGQVFINAVTDVGALNVGTATGAGSGQVFATVNNADTAAPVTVLALTHNSTGTPAPNFGADITVNLKSSTTVDQSALLIRALWATATHASRKARTNFFVYDTAARTVLSMEASGTAAMLGVLGAGAAVRQTVTGSRGGNAALASLLTAMATFGWITDSST